MYYLTILSPVRDRLLVQTFSLAVITDFRPLIQLPHEPERDHIMIRLGNQAARSGSTNPRSARVVLTTVSR